MKSTNQNISISKGNSRTTVGKLLLYLDKRSERFATALGTSRSYYSIEGIHDLRVEIKRLRAYFKLINAVTPSSADGPNADELKEIFRVAGGLRDIDIHQALIVNYLREYDLREYFNHLKAKELEVRKKFARVSGRLQPTILAGDRVKTLTALSPLSDRLIRARICKRARKLSTKLIKLAAKGNQHADRLHAIRKIAKTLRYTLDVLILCCGANRRVGMTLDTLKKTYNVLGEFRDVVLTRESLRSFVHSQKGGDLVDLSAYKSVEESLDGRAKQLVSSYLNGRTSLEKALTRLRSELPASATSRKATPVPADRRRKRKK